MGLDASVMCGCFREGRTSEPPVPRDWLRVDGEGYFELKPEFESESAYSKLYDWMLTCCDHPGMRFAWEHIANWAGYRLFQQALEGVGRERFPTLHHELPEANGGLTEAPKAAQALGELDEFRKLGDVGTIACLVDSATGGVLQEHVGVYEGVFIWDGRAGYDVGLDGSGLFIRDRETGGEFFRARRLRQTLLVWCFVDPGTNRVSRA